MSHISKIPLPSISLVLSTDHARVPRRSSMVKAAAMPVPCIIVHPPEEDMEESDLGDGEGYLTDDDSSVHKCHDHPSICDEEDEHMHLAESIYEVPIIERKEPFVVVRLIKEKISNVLFSFRRLLCVDFRQACFPGVPSRR